MWEKVYMWKKIVYVKKKEVVCVCVCVWDKVPVSLFKVFKLNIKFDLYFRVWNKKM